MNTAVENLGLVQRAIARAEREAGRAAEPSPLLPSARLRCRGDCAGARSRQRVFGAKTACRRRKASGPRCANVFQI